MPRKSRICSFVCGSGTTTSSELSIFTNSAKHSSKINIGSSDLNYWKISNDTTNQDLLFSKVNRNRDTDIPFFTVNDNLDITIGNSPQKKDFSNAKLLVHGNIKSDNDIIVDGGIKMNINKDSNIMIADGNKFLSKSMDFV